MKILRSTKYIFIMSIIFLENIDAAKSSNTNIAKKTSQNKPNHNFKKHKSIINGFFATIRTLINEDKVLEIDSYKIISQDLSNFISDQLIQIIENNDLNKSNICAFLSKFFELRIHPYNLNNIIKIVEASGCSEIYMSIIQTLKIMGLMDSNQKEKRKGHFNSNGLSIFLDNIGYLVKIHKLQKYEDGSTLLITQFSKDLVFYIKTLVNDGILNQSNILEFTKKLLNLNLHPDNKSEIKQALKAYALQGSPLITQIINFYLS